MDSTVQAKLNDANLALQAVGYPYKLKLYSPRDLKKLTKNARFMRNDTFAQFVDNIREDKALQGVPFVYEGPDEDKPLILSGNHRVMAAEAAGLDYVLCLTTDTQLTPEKKVSIQLAHNAIVGQDNLQTLKDLYDSIEDLRLKAYSGIDEELRKQLEAVKFTPIKEPGIRFKTATFLFLPAELDEIKEISHLVEKELGSETTYLFRMAEYEEFFEIVSRVKAKLNIKNSTVAIMEALRLGAQKLREAEPQETEPIAHGEANEA